VHGNGAVIENMTISEYLEYEVAKEKRLWDDVRSRRSSTYYNEADIDSFHRNKKEDQEDDSDDGDTFDMCDITVEDVERIRKFFNVPADIDEIVQPLIPEPIHTTPPNDHYEDDFNPTKDLEELERLLAEEPQSNFTKIQVDRDILSPGSCCILAGLYAPNLVLQVLTEIEQNS
ncbi:hypothetical protein Tco_0545404, partial [Tanacetum coccineum]